MSDTKPAPLEIIAEDGGKQYVECNRCARKTWHSVLTAARDFEEDGITREMREYQILECDGCRAITFRETWQLGSQNETPSIDQENLYPPRRDRKARRKLSGSNALPDRVSSIYSQTISAMNTKLTVLAGIGIRALVESVCKHKRLKGNNLQQRIDGLATAGLLGRVEAATLHRIRFLGNKAAHETKEPTPDELAAGMDIAEHLLETVYLLPKKAKKLPAR